MTNLRDKISLVVNGYGDGLPDDVALEAADDILAAIKASVPPLVWDDMDNKSVTKRVVGMKPYKIYEINRLYILEVGMTNLGGYPFITEAKAAANAHHVAQLTDWMMK